MRTQPTEIVRRLESDNSRKFKEEVLEKAVDEGLNEFFEGLNLCLDPLKPFNIKQVPERENEENNQGLSWNQFKNVAWQLINREITGHTATRAVEILANTATKEQWNAWYRRILLKDLNCGVQTKTVNNVCRRKSREDIAIPVFGCMLAHDAAQHNKKLVGRKQVSVKLDGVRAVLYAHGDTVNIYSREGRKFENFGHIEEEIAKANNYNEPIILDGEIMSSTFQDLMKQVHRKENVKANDAVLHLFDMMTYKEWKNGGSQKHQHARSMDVKSWVTHNESVLDHVAYIDWEVVDLDTEEGNDRLKELEKQALNQGYEGLVLKDTNAPYYNKRSHHWLKLKPSIEVTLEVKDVEEGTKRNEGRLGALVCEGKDDGKHIRVNVGSGFSDKQRDEFWQQKDQLPGNLVEVKADGVSQNQDSTYSLRFPRFESFRGFDSGEKL